MNFHGLVLAVTTLLPIIAPFADCCSSKVMQKRYQEKAVEQHAGEREDYEVIDSILRNSKCPDHLQRFYCLNEGRCFNFKIGNYNSYACECKDEFHGERCEYKYVIKRVRSGNDTYTDFQLERKHVLKGGGIKMADLCLAPLLVASSAIFFIIFLIKKKLIQNSKGHTNISSSRRAFHQATHQCRYNCS